MTNLETAINEICAENQITPQELCQRVAVANERRAEAAANAQAPVFNRHDADMIYRACVRQLVRNEARDMERGYPLSPAPVLVSALIDKLGIGHPFARAMQGNSAWAETLREYVANQLNVSERPVTNSDMPDSQANIEAFTGALERIANAGENLSRFGPLLERVVDSLEKEKPKRQIQIREHGSKMIFEEV